MHLNCTEHFTLFTVHACLRTGNATRPGQQGNSSVYAEQLRQIATRLSTFCEGGSQCSLLFALTSAMICNVKANDNVAGVPCSPRPISGRYF